MPPFLALWLCQALLCRGRRSIFRSADSTHTDTHIHIHSVQAHNNANTLQSNDNSHHRCPPRPLCDLAPLAPDLRSSSLGWLRFSRFFSMRSARSCLRTTVAYSMRPCSAAIRREATLPRSRMEKERCASSVWMNVNRNILLCSSWLNRRRAFSTLAGD